MSRPKSPAVDVRALEERVAELECKFDSYERAWAIIGHSPEATHPNAAKRDRHLRVVR
jgi:hypothetical protein